MEILYSGENLLAGQAGHFLLILAFVGSLVAMAASYLSFRSVLPDEKKRWQRIVYGSWYLQSAAIIGAIAILYSLIFNHSFEYDYVRRHSAEGMPLKYLISCMWAGQQGSFLLWLFWNSILGILVIFTTKKEWAVPVMAVFGLLQAILTSMLLGIFIPRGIALAALILFLNIPLWILFKRNNLPGWKSLVPLLNLVILFAKRQLLENKVLLILLAIPINFFVLVYIPLNISEIIGFFTGEVRMGISPFVLSRVEFSDNAIFLFDDYLLRISGRGLNPLLQNYWMVIHPPTLFLGFALTIVPFAFAIAGLWLKQANEWVRYALPWSLFAGLVLGVGIMLGGVWAYEALSFGGFWAWDPVENASLVPWLTLIAGIHTLLVYKHTGHALKVTHLLLFLTLFFILFSTFLTRSGILGESSVHSFTDLGMMGQLIILILAMMVPAIVLLIDRWKELPSPEKEENTFSREFWMFIGALILLIASLQIIFSTSLPVFNSINAWLNHLTGLSLPDNMALPKDQEGFYNSIQVWIGIIIALLAASVQFFKYKNTPIRTFLKNITPIAFISLVIAGALEAIYGFDNFAYLLLLFTGLFAFLANLQYLFFVIKAKIRLSGASVAHIGFGLVMIGLVISLSKSHVISKSDVDFGEGIDPEFKNKNIYMVRDKAYQMGDYTVVFKGREKDGIDYHYEVMYLKINSETGDTIKSYSLHPHLMNHPDMGIVANPATKRFVSKDIFTHVTSIPMAGDKQPLEGPNITRHEVALKDTFFTSRGKVVLENLQRIEEGDDVAAILYLTTEEDGQVYSAQPMFIIREGAIETKASELPDLKLIFEIEKIDPQKGKFTIKVTDSNEWIIMKAIIFPFINILWLGIIVCFTGFGIALFRRIKDNKRIKHVA